MAQNKRWEIMIAKGLFHRYHGSLTLTSWGNWKRKSGTSYSRRVAKCANACFCRQQTHSPPAPEVRLLRAGGRRRGRKEGRRFVRLRPPRHVRQRDDGARPLRRLAGRPCPPRVRRRVGLAGALLRHRLFGALPGFQNRGG